MKTNKVNIEGEGGYTSSIRQRFDDEDMYNVSIQKDDNLIKSLSLEAERLGDAVEKAEFELLKTKFQEENKRFIEMLTILGVGGIDLVEFIKNDLESFGECECLDGLADLIEEELSCASE